MISCRKPKTQFRHLVHNNSIDNLEPCHKISPRSCNTVFISGLGSRSSGGGYHGYDYHPDTDHVTCHVCSKVFRGSSRAQNLKRHFNNVHLKLKPFRCMVCGMMFGLKYNLKSHMSRAHHMGDVVGVAAMAAAARMRFPAATPRS